MFRCLSTIMCPQPSHSLFLVDLLSIRLTAPRSPQHQRWRKKTLEKVTTPFHDPNVCGALDGVDDAHHHCLDQAVEAVRTLPVRWRPAACWLCVCDPHVRTGRCLSVLNSRHRQ